MGQVELKAWIKQKNQNNYVEGGKWIKGMSVCTYIVFSVLCYSSEIIAKVCLFKNTTMSVLSQIRGLFSMFSAPLFQPESDT